MSLLVKGVSRLLSLEIDIDKNWAGRSIKNLGAAVDSNDAVRKAQAILQSLMTDRGDIIYRGNNGAVRLGRSYGVGYNFLHVKNTGQLEPEWLDIQDLKLYNINRCRLHRLTIISVIAYTELNGDTIQPPCQE